ncbi:MAG: DUF1003 domain-containing protein [Chloroflexota bacterium]
MTTQMSPARKQRTREVDAPKANPAATGDILRAVDALEDQLEQLLGPRPNPAPPIIRNVNTVVAEQMSVGDRVADAVAITMGSWRFIGIQSALLTVWVTLNVIGWVNHWDPYPFILLNLALSFQAAYSAPIIMMSQNRQAAKDRIMAEEDFRVNHVAEDEIRAIITHLERQDRVMLYILARLAHPDKAAKKIVRRVSSVPARASAGHSRRPGGRNHE